MNSVAAGSAAAVGLGHGAAATPAGYLAAHSQLQQQQQQQSGYFTPGVTGLAGSSGATGQPSPSATGAGAAGFPSIASPLAAGSGNVMSSGGNHNSEVGGFYDSSAPSPSATSAAAAAAAAASSLPAFVGSGAASATNPLGVAGLMFPVLSAMATAGNKAGGGFAPPPRAAELPAGVFAGDAASATAALVALHASAVDAARARAADAAGSAASAEVTADAAAVAEAYAQLLQQYQQPQLQQQGSGGSDAAADSKNNGNSDSNSKNSHKDDDKDDSKDDEDDANDNKSDDDEADRPSPALSTSDAAAAGNGNGNSNGGVDPSSFGPAPPAVTSPEVVARAAAASESASAAAASSVDPVTVAVPAMSSILTAPSARAVLVAPVAVLIETVLHVLRRDRVRQKDLAASIGLSGSTLSPMLRGKYRHTKDAHMTRLREWVYQRDKLFVTSVLHQVSTMLRKHDLMKLSNAVVYRYITIIVAAGNSCHRLNVGFYVIIQISLCSILTYCLSFCIDVLFSRRARDRPC